MVAIVSATNTPLLQASLQKLSVADRLAGIIAVPHGMLSASTRKRHHSQGGLSVALFVPECNLAVL